MSAYIENIYQQLNEKLGHESEFLQAVGEFLDAVEPVMAAHPEYEDLAVLERITAPERVIIFRVPWMDDQGKIHVNTGYRVQFSSLNGPYKGGLRFHPTVNLSILKFLGFEQIFKNILTGLPIGGGKGGADFDPKGKSDNEIMRFCQSFMTELSKHIAPDLDVPAGDIGVGGREIGFLYGQYKRLRQADRGILTGKPLISGGSLIRPEATGFGLVYFLTHMLAEAGQDLKGKKVIISGSGNVAYFAARKVEELGGIVVSMSDSQGAIYEDKGIDLDVIKAIKVDSYSRIKEYLETYPEANYQEGSVWNLDMVADIALPCATQNEVDEIAVARLAKGGVEFIAEGANMPLTSAAAKAAKNHGIVYAPGKAANAGGVAVSALEMSQNSMRLSWSREEVDQQLQDIMADIFKACLAASQAYDFDHDYAKGADIAAFEKVVELMQIQGLV